MRQDSNGGIALRGSRLNAPMVDHLTPLLTASEVEHFRVDPIFEFLEKGKAA